MNNQKHHFCHEAMATTFELTIISDDYEYSKQAAEASFKEIDRLEGTLSRFSEGSDIAVINSAEPEDLVKVGLDTFECLKLARQKCIDTDGAFDMTIGSAFDRAKEDDQEPSFILYEDTFEILIKKPNLQIDLGGIGKGYALDCVSNILEDWDMDHVLLNAGKSTVLSRIPKGVDGWSMTIGYRDQVKELLVRNQSLSGSGTAVKGYHVIDPRTGRRVEDRVRTWALAATAAESDALSTAFMIMSVEEIESYCGTHTGTAAVLILDATLTCFGFYRERM